MENEKTMAGADCDSFWEGVVAAGPSEWRRVSSARIGERRRVIWERGLSREGTVAGAMDEFSREVLGAARAAFLLSGFPDGWAVAATGGTGRGEIFPWSDTDLMLAIPEDVSPEGEESGAEAAQVLETLLWDAGLKPSICARTPEDCKSEGERDVTISSSMLDLVFVAGDGGLFERAREEARVTDAADFFTRKEAESGDRRRSEGGDTGSLEPSVKESPGGLRDFHALSAQARAAGLPGDPAGMAEEGLLSFQEAEALSFHLARVSEARAWLHTVSGCAREKLDLRAQEEVSAAMGLGPLEGKSAAEAFMEGFHSSAKAILFLCSVGTEALRERLFPAEGEPEPLDSDFVAHGGRLRLSSPDALAKNPSAAMKALVWMQRRADLVGMGSDTLRALGRAARRTDPWFRADERNKRLFMEILSSPRAVSDQLAIMRGTGLLAAWMPAFGRVENLLQRDMSHVFTVGRHSVAVARNVRRMTCPEHAHELPLHSRIASAHGRLPLVVLSALLHDLGKGSGRPHEIEGGLIAREFCTAHGLSDDDVSFVSWLVESHLEMSRVSQKKDVHDPETRESFAAYCQTRERLEALFMLTAADMRATGPGVWTPWKARLLEDLFVGAGRVLDSGPRRKEGPDDVKKREARAEMRRLLVPEGVERALWRTLDPSYFMRHDASAMAWHARSVILPRDAGATIVKARVSDGRHSGDGLAELEVMVWTPDVPGVFSSLCSWLSENGWSVDEALLQTTSAGQALDTLRIHDCSGRGMARDLAAWVEKGLSSALSSGTPPAVPGRVGRPSPMARRLGIMPSATLESDGMGGWIMEVSCVDAPGILREIAACCAEAGVSVVSARVSTAGARVEDVFLLRGDVLTDHMARVAFCKSVTDRLS